MTPTRHEWVTRNLIHMELIEAIKRRRWAPQQMSHDRDKEMFAIPILRYVIIHTERMKHFCFCLEQTNFVEICGSDPLQLYVWSQSAGVVSKFESRYFWTKNLLPTIKASKSKPEATQNHPPKFLQVKHWKCSEMCIPLFVLFNCNVFL